MNANPCFRNNLQKRISETCFSTACFPVVTRNNLGKKFYSQYCRIYSTLMNANPCFRNNLKKNSLHWYQVHASVLNASRDFLEIKNTVHWYQVHASVLHERFPQKKSSYSTCAPTVWNCFEAFLIFEILKLKKFMVTVSAIQNLFLLLKMSPNSFKLFWSFFNFFIHSFKLFLSFFNFFIHSWLQFLIKKGVFSFIYYDQLIKTTFWIFLIDAKSLIYYPKECTEALVDKIGSYF